MRYNYLKRTSQILFSFLLISSCSDNQIAKDPIEDEESNPEIVITVDPDQTFQAVDNFGASDAWSCQFVGNWPDDKKNAIADLLFSTDSDTNGNPRGIGLSLWRFNIGAGSAQQGNESGIQDEWRRAESFLQDDGTYDWQRQQGQRWFLEAAENRGVNKFLAFPNSPPVELTRNGKAYASGGVSNLAPDQYPSYAEYLVEVMKGLKNLGTEIDYISPVNEPQWDWSDGGQEGTPFTNQEIYGIVNALNSALEKDELDIKIDIAEAGKINYLYATEDKPNRGDQIKTFFSGSSPNYIGDLSKVGKVISGHSYFTTSPFPEAINKRKTLAAELSSVPGLEFWMSEYCILGDNEGEIKGEGRDLGIDPALYLARVIHNDLTVANASAWHWWIAVSPYDYKDGLIYVDKNKTDGNFYESKLLWALGNFSRFIRPGAVRIAVTSPELNVSTSSLLVSAYKHPESNQLTMVIVNSSVEEKKLKLAFKDTQVNNLQAFVTSKDQDLFSAGEVTSDSISVAPRSITTLIGNTQ